MRLTLKEQRDRASLYWLFGLFVLLPMTAVFGHRGVAPWLLLAALPAFARGDFWQSAFGQLFDKPDLRDPFFACFTAAIVFCLWIFLSGFWSPKGQPSLMLNVLAPILVGGSLVWFSLNLPRVWAWRLSVAFAMSIGAGIIVLLFEGVTDGFLRGVLPPNDPTPNNTRDLTALGRGVTALAPALFPAGAIAAMVWRRWVGAVIIIAGIFAASTQTVAANTAAVLFGIAVCLIAMKAPRSTMSVLGWSLIGLLRFAPLMYLLPVDQIFSAYGDQMPPSWLHRVAVWQSVSERIVEGLPFGFGADYARIWKETAPLIEVPGSVVPLSVMPTHPHNVFLQIWLELGLPGVMAILTVIYFGMRVLKRADLPTVVVVGLCGSVAAIMVSLLIEGSLWQVWRLAAIALAAMGVALSWSLYRIRVA